MQVWALITWWYGAGWVAESQLQSKRLARVESYFSFGTLLRTLFQPFRQIDAGSRSLRSGVSAQFRAWLDRTISRVIGASARLILIVVGLVWWCISALMSACWLLVWPFLPLAPVLGCVAAAFGVGTL